jgi:hypothetical protein
MAYSQALPRLSLATCSEAPQLTSEEATGGYRDIDVVEGAERCRVKGTLTNS